MSVRSKLATRLSFLVFLLFLTVMPLSMASAQNTGFPLAVELTRSAMEDYDFFELESADNKLLQAVQIVETLGISEPSAANIFIAQGVVSYGRFKDSAPAIADERAFSAFLKALTLNKDVVIPNDYRTSELEAILDRARKAIATAPKSAAIVLAQAKPEIKHDAIVSNNRCVPMEVRATVPAHPDIYRVTLHYAAGDSGFETLEMQPALQTTDQLVAIIPGMATTGGRVQYYIEARNRAGEVVANVSSSIQPLTTVMVGECEGLPQEEIVESYGDPLFQFSVMIGTGFGFVSDKVENCQWQNCVGDHGKISNGFAPLPFHLRASGMFNLPHNMQLGFYVRGQIVNIAASALTTGVKTDLNNSGYPPEMFNVMVGLSFRWLAIAKQPYRLYIGLEAGWGGANASVFMKLKETNETFVDMYLYKGPFHIAPEIGFLWTFHKNVGLNIELAVPIHFPDRPSFHFDLSIGPYFQF
jgi:hypothetical protein